MNQTNIDISLASPLYEGCEIETVGGRANLVTPIAEAIEIVGRNAQQIVAGIARKDRDTVTLTGPMAVWAHLVVFHAVVHAFREVRYDDGRSGPVVIARHG